MDLVSTITDKGVAVYLPFVPGEPVACRLSGRTLAVSRADGSEETWRVGERTASEILARQSVSVFELEGSEPVRVRVIALSAQGG